MKGCKKKTLEIKSDNFWENCGGISACDANAESAMQYRESLEFLHVKALKAKVAIKAGKSTIQSRVKRLKI